MKIENTDSMRDFFQKAGAAFARQDKFHRNYNRWKGRKAERQAALNSVQRRQEVAIRQINELSPGLLEKLEEIKELAPAFRFRPVDYAPRSHVIIETNIPMTDDRVVPAELSDPVDGRGSTYCCDIIVHAGSDAHAPGSITIAGSGGDDGCVSGTNGTSWSHLTQQNQFLYDLSYLLHARGMVSRPQQTPGSIDIVSSYDPRMA